MRRSFRESLGRLFPFARINFLFLSIFIFCNYLAALTVMNLLISRFWQEVLVVSLVLPFAAFLFSGYIYCYVNSVRGVSVSTMQIFRGYRRYLPMLFFSVLWCLIFLFSVPMAYQFTEMGFIGKSRIIIGILIFIYLIIRTLFVPVYLIDRKMSLADSFRESWSLTGGFFPETLILFTVCLFIFIAGLVCFVVGAVFSLSVIALIYVHSFDSFTGARK